MNLAGFNKRSDPFVSIIMPAHNAEPWIGEAIDSVLAQTHPQWELIVVVDGSTDRTEPIVREYDDERIRCIGQAEQRGVSAARNRGLRSMEGDYLLFFDADDILFPRSLESRLELFRKDPEIAFVDGKVLITGPSGNKIKETWSPNYEGFPKRELLALKDSCFVSITWLIRADAVGNVRFDEKLTHCEDLDFFLSIADQGKYSYVDEPIMYFRRTGRSAMSDLEGLERGYRWLSHKWKEKAEKKGGGELKEKAKRILFRSYLKEGALLKAIRSQRGW